MRHFNGYFPGKAGLASCPLEIRGFDAKFYGLCALPGANHQKDTLFLATTAAEREVALLPFAAAFRRQCPNVICYLKLVGW